ncbi:hypothetical protein ACVOMV_15570 [Mesorhizobium atlanticum]
MKHIVAHAQPHAALQACRPAGSERAVQVVDEQSAARCISIIIAVAATALILQWARETNMSGSSDLPAGIGAAADHQFAQPGLPDHLRARALFQGQQQAHPGCLRHVRPPADNGAQPEIVGVTLFSRGRESQRGPAELDGSHLRRRHPERSRASTILRSTSSASPVVSLSARLLEQDEAPFAWQ